MTVNSIDVTSKLIKTVKIPGEFVLKYAHSIVSRVLEMDETNKDRTKLARIVASFVKNFKKNKLSGCEQFQ
jgi:hypothetical protein